ncbi:hypothetical protein [Sphingobium sp. MK2]|uniref:hypothetical protein n=1 Tax=Sphingobium sp. MK2 TaxID=3116540 RepID=UPI0032E35A6B
MTTIAIRDGIIAADTRISYRTFHNGTKNKIARCGRFYVALAGMGNLRRPLEQWAEAGCAPDNLPEVLVENRKEFSALFLDSDGRIFEFDEHGLLEIEANYTAIGSGGFFAMGAMAHGANAVEAVKAASLHDLASGGEIHHAHFSSLTPLFS